MKELTIFNNPEFGEVRVIELDGEAFFVGRDVAIALGYANPNDALTKHVPDKFKRVSQIATPSGTQNMTVINEAGMYKLVMRSKLPNAERFSDWVCETVLPSIRKHGVYATSDFISKSIADPTWAIGILTELKAKQDEAALLKVQLAEAKPKLDYCDTILQCTDLVTTSVIAKDYGYSAKKFNKLLHECGVQFKQGMTWLLYHQYASQGWSQTKTHKYIGGDGEIHCSVHTYWTQKGRLGLYKLLKHSGYLPIIEQAA
ncbi:MAG: phage antirepressor [Selenomonadaceae bacterium]|nr:phage antirepressor [Selenomonadaceae bacterium]